MKTVTIVLACYNEEENLGLLYERLVSICATVPQYQFQFLFIDNASTDRSVEIIKSLALSDSRVQLIVNARNFGHIRSPYYALMQTNADAVILMATDFQDPPEVILEFLQQWEAGHSIVVGVKNLSDEPAIMFRIRKFYYGLIARISDGEVIQNFTGYGLYDRKFIRVLQDIRDPYPYFRGLISELGFGIVRVNFKQPRRERGVTKNNFYTLYDMAILGITSNSKLPIRLATLFGTVLSAISFLMAVVYLILKLLFWSYFPMGVAPILIAIFFFFSVQLLFIGLLGEYISFIHVRLLNRPLVIEKERVNF